jgi:CubicO group peptidase (beta-lactamase class C family)
VYYGDYGYADREADVPMNRDTIVRIFSMTKPIVGVALMTLYDKGAFQLDDPLEKYAPEFSNMQVYVGYDEEKQEPILEPADRPITVRDITRHTAGFARAWEGMPALEGSDRPTDASNTLQEMAEKLGKLPLGFQPGTQWAYGDSVDVQAFLVERISGIPFAQYLRENVLDPLGMTDTRYYVPEEDRDRFAATYKYDRDSGELTRVPDEDAQSYNFNHWPLTRGGWGLTSTLDDYQTFARLLANGGTLDGVTILKPETVKLMATNHLDESVTERMWLPSRGQVGFGIDFAVRLAPPVDEAENNGVVGEFFWDGALSTLFWVDPVNDLTAVMFVQLTPYDQIELHNAFRDAVYGNYVPGGN